MKLRSPQTYSLELLDGGPYRLFSEGVACKFSKPASTEKHPKLYTLAAGGKLLYVGIASQSMSSRLSSGFRAKGKGGYHGYKWKTLRHRLALSVWTADREDKPATLRDLETIEAEVAFLCRQQSEQWPEYQHEIHFYSSLPVHREAAKEIYSHAIQRSA
jgi:hypothetical protein